MRRILVLGGGTAGTLAANLMARELGPEIKRGEVEITLLDKDGKHLFQPNFLYIAFKGMKPEKIERSEKKLLHKNVRYFTDSVAKVDFKKREVLTENKSIYFFICFLPLPLSDPMQIAPRVRLQKERHLTGH